MIERPDRIALWAVLLAVVAMIAGAASAHAGGSSGGIGGAGGIGGSDASGSGGGAGGNGGDASESGTPGCLDREFGRRTLKVGDCGDDVETLNWILKSKNYRRAPLVDSFGNPTAAAVRRFQQNAAIGADGVVDDATTSALVRSMPSQLATWYGPGFWGNETACGEKLRKRTFGVAHKTLPCGSKVVVRYRGRYLRTEVIDRGPYANGAKWDLTEAAAESVGLKYTDEIRVAKLSK